MLAAAMPLGCKDAEGQSVDREGGNVPSRVERLQEPSQGGMEGISLVGPLPCSQGPRDRLVSGSGELPPGPAGGHPQSCSWQERGFVPVPCCASQLWALSVRLNTELNNVSKRINFLILL